MSAALGLRGVEVHRGGRSILTVDRLDVEAGETLAVLGANGAGKSTLVRVFGGLTAVECGERLLDGRPAGGRELRLASAAVLQRPLLRRATVAANAATGLRFRGVGRREASRRARPWLERLEIASLADRQAATLSGGEAQRVSIARALAIEPRILLLDEPFAGIDAPTRLVLLSDLRELLTDSGTTAVLATHDRAEAAALADRLAVLDRGRVIREGALPDVLADPVHPAAARLLGYENVLALDGGVVAIRAREVVLGAAAPEPAIVLDGIVRRVVRTADSSRVTVAAEVGTVIADIAAAAPERGARVAVTLPDRALRELR